VLLPYARYSGAEARLGFFQDLARQVRALPGSREVALTDWVPLSGGGHAVAVEAEGDGAGTAPGGREHGVAQVDGEYFRTLRIPLAGGRTFGAQEASRPVEEAIVSRAFAERYWPGESPLGKRVRRLGGRWHSVVGVVGDVRYDGLEEPPGETVYFPIVYPAAEGSGASLPAALSLVVRTGAGEVETLASIRRIVASIDPGIPTFDEGPLRQVVHQASARPRAMAALLAIASAVTLLLGAVGLYGAMAYGVSIRRRELGIRLALGARPADLRRMVSLDGARLAGAGIAIGTGCALATSRLLRGLLYEVSPGDPLTLAGTAAALLLVAFIASWIPARRAAAVEPNEALRTG
jgi:putative ABC transport system permease protein